jgi:glycerol-3-phosphate dehydrogenase
MGKNTEFIRGTKGSHLVLDHPELWEAIGDHELFFENARIYCPKKYIVPI